MQKVFRFSKMDFRLLCILYIAFTSCNSNGTLENDNCIEYSDSGSLNDSIHGSWSNVKTIFPRKAELYFDSSGSFQYRSHRTFSSGFYTTGMDTVILQSVLPDSCLFMRFFGSELLPLKQAYDSLLNAAVTISECEPTTKSVFINFNNVPFLFNNDTLYHIDNNNEIDTLNIFFHNR